MKIVLTVLPRLHAWSSLQRALLSRVAQLGEIGCPTTLFYVQAPGSSPHSHSG